MKSYLVAAALVSAIAAPAFADDLGVRGARAGTVLEYHQYHRDRTAVICTHVGECGIQGFRRGYTDEDRARANIAASTQPGS